MKQAVIAPLSLLLYENSFSLPQHSGAAGHSVIWLAATSRVGFTSSKLFAQSIAFQAIANRTPNPCSWLWQKNAPSHCTFLKPPRQPSTLAWLLATGALLCLLLTGQQLNRSLASSGLARQGTYCFPLLLNKLPEPVFPLRRVPTCTPALQHRNYRSK